MIEWSEEREANSDCYYNHVIGKTKLGDFNITWKGWKEHPSYAIDQCPPGEGRAWSLMEQRPIFDLQEAKDACFMYYVKLIKSLEEDFEEVKAIEDFTKSISGLSPHP